MKLSTKRAGFLLGIIAVLLLSLPSDLWSQVSGAVFTTTNPAVDNTTGDTVTCFNGPPEVLTNPAIDCNLYATKRFVWLNGGPSNNGLSPAGTYFFAVLVPGGQGGNENPNDGTPNNLSDDFDSYKNRTFTIGTNGEVSSYTGNILGGETPHDFDLSDSSNPKIRLFPYADTTNPGGEYVMAVCHYDPDTYDPVNNPVTPSDCKYDNFKVREGADLCFDVQCAAPDACQEAGVCNPDTGLCEYNPKPAGTLCRVASGACDVPESCDGQTGACPADAFASAATECRAAAGVCDVPEFCTGTSADCPADAKSTALCRASTGICDVAESCDGVNNDCPADTFASTTTLCRASAGACDVPEFCTGLGADCPADAKSTAVCRASAGVCDVAESCDGVNNDCPTDAVASSTTLCRDATDVCDVAEFCDGLSKACPADAVASSTTVCRASAGVCDVAESCDGVSKACPADAFVVAGTECRAAAGVCDVAEFCTGSSAACPADSFKAATTVCRASTGDCDVTELCTGNSALCPADAVVAAGTLCRSPEACVTAGFCDGSDKFCPDDEHSCLLGICRTAGFWGTHAGTEKKGTKNITQAVINVAPLGVLNVCGEHIINTKLNDAASAEEALCVSIQGAQVLQLARQLTAAALNCVITGGNADCSGTSIADVFEACNTQCAGGQPAGLDCVPALDCINNGGIFHETTGFCQTGNCSDNLLACNAGDRTLCANPATATCVVPTGDCEFQPLVNSNIGLNFNPPGDAGSSNACNTAIGNTCTVTGTGEVKCTIDSAP